MEEAEDVPEASWLAWRLRCSASQSRRSCGAIWNPRIDGSPVDQRSLRSRRTNALIVDMQLVGQPLPGRPETLRKREQERLDRMTYAHVEGAYLTNSDSLVSVRAWACPSPSVRWLDGTSVSRTWTTDSRKDPTAAVKLWVHRFAPLG